MPIQHARCGVLNGANSGTKTYCEKTQMIKIACGLCINTYICKLNTNKTAKANEPS